jgi:anti-sigma regulatory factor (Ser/Thr protein kinase)
MLVDTTFIDVLAALGELEHELDDEVVPAQQPALPSNSYRDEYAWQYSYERSLMKRTKDWLGMHRNELIGASGLLSEALSNAYVHGNQRDPYRPIRVGLFVGKHGYVLRVIQSGTGFDVNQVLTRFRSKRRYFSIGGNGLRRLDESRTFRVFFAHDGRAVHLWHGLDPGVG